MFVLQLNNMRDKAEIIQPVAWAETQAALVAFLDRERVTPYITEGHWHKCFRAGGPLEWFNEPTGNPMEVWVDVPAIVDVGTREDWQMKAGERFDELRQKLLCV